MEDKGSAKVSLPFLSKHRNQVLSLGFVLFALTAIFVLPYEPLDVLTPQTRTYIAFQAFYPSTRSYLDRGYVWATSKGGISADNPITLAVTLYTNPNSNITINSIYFTAEGCYAYPIQTNALGFPIVMAMALQPQGQNKWVSGDFRVIYFKPGDYSANITLVGATKVNPGTSLIMQGPTLDVIHISGEDVTVAAKTNALLLSLSLAFLAFSCLELRVEDNRKCKNHEQQQDYQRNVAGQV